jgi:hypothetical protein
MGKGKHLKRQDESLFRVKSSYESFQSITKLSRRQPSGNMSNRQAAGVDLAARRLILHKDGFTVGGDIFARRGYENVFDTLRESPEFCFECNSAKCILNKFSIPQNTFNRMIDEGYSHKQIEYRIQMFKLETQQKRANNYYILRAQKRNALLALSDLNKALIDTKFLSGNIRLVTQAKLYKKVNQIKSLIESINADIKRKAKFTIPVLLSKIEQSKLELELESLTGRKREKLEYKIDFTTNFLGVGYFTMPKISDENPIDKTMSKFVKRQYKKEIAILQSIKKEKGDSVCPSTIALLSKLHKCVKTNTTL